MLKSVKKGSIRVTFCHFLQTIKFALTPLQQRTKRNLTPNLTQFDNLNLRNTQYAQRNANISRRLS